MNNFGVESSTSKQKMPYSSVALGSRNEICITSIYFSHVRLSSQGDYLVRFSERRRIITDPLKNTAHIQNLRDKRLLQPDFS